LSFNGLFITVEQEFIVTRDSSRHCSPHSNHWKVTSVLNSTNSALGNAEVLLVKGRMQTWLWN